MTTCKKEWLAALEKNRDRTRKEIRELIAREGTGKEFQHRGYQCRIVRHRPVGHLCGYVELTDADQLFGVELTSEVDDLIEMHGGCTFAARRWEGGYYIGFDCAHAWDHIPNIHKTGEEPARTYRDMAFVEAELRRTAEALAELKQGGAKA